MRDFEILAKQVLNQFPTEIKHDKKVEKAQDLIGSMYDKVIERKIFAMLDSLTPEELIVLWAHIGGKVPKKTKAEDKH